ncbi:hypothetical protein LEP1GSC186_0250 [Leptospira noguchii serovar Autumnalis str. ZUN142]|uniref:Uncharacterized protein n=1 Tax=Leptospira noguchii serovar Autumnalis str. ZUN142 TaxID=1085540 RepID=M6UDE5_9LEPT|nr:hypothetical protein LEP1GSC186_0250 [Leptospira noguchii serovar Autumnalis str. ZUN142]
MIAFSCTVVSTFTLLNSGSLIWPSRWPNKIVSSKNFSTPSEPIRFRHFTKLVGSQGKSCFKWLVG